MSDKIFYGVWINWSRGKWNGSTITLSPSSANVLIAFLAIFVSVAGSALWRILAFTLHQRSTTKSERDGLHYQHQAILRNTTNPGVASWQFLWLIPPWTKMSRRPILRTLPLACLALINLLVFFAAGILVAEVTRTTGSEVLIRSADCGNWTLSTTHLVLGMHTKTLNDTLTASSYSRACYGGKTSALECRQYAMQSLPYTTDTKNESEACPFEEGMCLINWPVYTLDTGNLSSHDHLGINTKSKDRITYRRKTTCAPIKTKNFLTSMNCTDAKNQSIGSFSCSDGDVMDFYNFGPIVDSESQTTRNNFTHAYNRRAAKVGYGYGLSAVGYNSGDEEARTNTWIPDQALIRDDADVTLMFLSANDIRYYEQVQDPIFQATLEAGYIMDNGKNVTFYESKYYVNTLACVEQHQFCNPTNDQCTALDSYSTAVRSAQKDLQLNPLQYATVSLMSLNLWFSMLVESIGGRSNAALRAQEQVSGLISGPIPDTQWQNEVDYWFTTGLAKIQKYTVDYAKGPENVLDGTYVSKPNDTVSRQLCNNQIIQAPAGSGAMSFSTLGVSIIVAIGGLLILAHAILDCVVGNVVQGRSYRLTRWAMDKNLQLQRLAFEGAGLGKWKAGVQSVPVTRDKDMFGVDLQGEKTHPTFYYTYYEGGDVERQAGRSEKSIVTETTMQEFVKYPGGSESLESPVSSGDANSKTDFTRGLSLTSEPIDWPFGPSTERDRDNN